MQLEEFTARVLTPDEVRALTPEDVIYVPDFDTRGTGERANVLVEASIPKSSYPEHIRTSNGSEWVTIRDIYGSESGTSIDDIYVADPEGEKKIRFAVAGTNIRLSLMVPGLDEETTRKRVYDALRKEFGNGVVEVWSVKSRPVKALRWDIVEETTEWVPDPEHQPRQGSKRKMVPTRKRGRVVASNVYEGHAQYFVPSDRNVSYVRVAHDIQHDTETI